VADMKIQDSVFPFLCDNPECKHEYDLDAFINIVLLWGFIFHTNEKYSLLGITCPECHKTTLQKYPNFATNNLRETLENKSADIKYVIPFSIKILKSQSLIDHEKPVNKGDVKDWYRIPFGFALKPGYKESISEQYPYFIDEDIISNLLEIENNSQLKVFPRIVPLSSVYLTHEPVLMSVDGSKEIPYEIIDDINETYLAYLPGNFATTTGNHYGHMLKNNMKPDEPLVVYPGTWTKKLTQNVGRYVRHYQKRRNRIDFELIYKNDFFNRYARIFYRDPAEWNRRRFDAEEFTEILTNYELEYLSEQNSIENNSTDSITPEKAQSLFPSQHSSVKPPLQENQKSMRTSTKDRIECQKKAIELWGEAQKNGAYILSTGEMANHPEIDKIGGAYTKAQRQRWLSQVAPEEAKKAGVRRKNRL
jgi:hypothetical protein